MELYIITLLICWQNNQNLRLQLVHRRPVIIRQKKIPHGKQNIANKIPTTLNSWVTKPT